MSDNASSSNKIKELAATGLLSVWLAGCTNMANKSYEEYNFCPDPEKFHQNLEILDKPLLAPVQMIYAAGGMTCYTGQEIIRIPIKIGGLVECGIRNLFSENAHPENQIPTKNNNPQNPVATIESNLPEFCQRIK